MKTAAAYIRVSTDDQVEYSPDSQLKLIRQYAAKNGMIVPDEFVFVDDGISGRTAANRPGFNQMIGTAKQKPKPFDAILLWKFSRFARSREDSIVYKSMLRKQLGIEVVSISENLGDDKMSILMEAMIEAMDEYYSINLAEEVRRGMAEKFSRGQVISQPPFGYRAENNRFVPDPETAPLVQYLFTEFAAGRGCRELALQFNETGSRTRRGNLWENRTIEYILENPVYIGKLRRWEKGGETQQLLLTEGQHDPLISLELWERVQRRLLQNRESHIPYARGECGRMYMLHGLLRCDCCGSALTLASSSPPGVQCCAYAKGKCAVSHYITLEKINQAVLDSLEEDLAGRKIQLDIPPPPSLPAGRSLLSARLEREKRRLDRIREAYTAGIDTLEEYQRSKADILRAIQALESEAKKFPGPEKARKTWIHQVRDVLQTVRDPAETEEAKNLLLRSLVDEIIFCRKVPSIQIIYRLSRGGAG